MKLPLIFQQKNWANAQFKKLNVFLQHNLGGYNEQRKSKIIRRIDAESKTKKLHRKKESIFKNIYLSFALSQFCSRFKYNIKPIIEGDRKQTKTKSEQMIFGTNPSADFLFISQEPTLFKSSVPFPIDTVGELKYDKLNFRAFVTGLGQLIGYLNINKFHGNIYRYGFYIFFNIDLGREVTSAEDNFLQDLWERENIFVCII